MNYWLIKQEPEAFSWDDFVKDGLAVWDGVRNYAARNNLQAMKEGEYVLFYHSVTGKEVVGIAFVHREAYPDPTDEKWTAVDFTPYKPLNKRVGLSVIKACPELQDIALVRIGRLSVMPLKKEEFELILQLGETSLP